MKGLILLHEGGKTFVDCVSSLGDVPWRCSQRVMNGVGIKIKFDFLKYYLTYFPVTYLRIVLSCCIKIFIWSQLSDCIWGPGKTL